MKTYKNHDFDDDFEDFKYSEAENINYMQLKTQKD